jgi:hypothetical protein
VKHQLVDLEPFHKAEESLISPELLLFAWFTTRASTYALEAPTLVLVQPFIWLKVPGISKTAG